MPPKVVFPDNGSEYFEAPSAKFLEERAFKKEPLLEKRSKTIKSAPKKITEKKAKIAIVIDDVGMNLKQSRAAIALPPQVTLAFLPYAEKVRALAKEAGEKGHELIIHTPMEAMDTDVSLGSMALRDGMDFAQIEAEFNKISGAFEGYVGINNHMGSRLTQNPEIMGYLMDLLRQRGLYFLDSKTIHTSVAAETAKTYGIPYAVRDVFLDHEETPEFTKKALEEVERIAQEHGQAIAIGHPKAVTMKALKKWISGLKKKGFELVPLSELIIVPPSPVLPDSNSFSALPVQSHSLPLE